jgi:hypothetical protein
MSTFETKIIRIGIDQVCIAVPGKRYMDSVIYDLTSRSHYLSDSRKIMKVQIFDDGRQITYLQKDRMLMLAYFDWEFLPPTNNNNHHYHENYTEEIKAESF